GIPGAGAATAALPVRARGLPVPAALRLAVRVGLPPGRPAVRPAEPRAAGSGRSSLAADARRPVDADVGGLAGDRVPAVPVRGAVAEQGTCTQSGHAPVGGAALADLHAAVPGRGRAGGRHDRARLPSARRRADPALR